MSRKLNQAYSNNLELIKGMNSEAVVRKFYLTKFEIELMRFLYKDQIEEERIVEHMVNYGLSKKDAKKILPSLKKKGLVYEVEEDLVNTFHFPDANEDGEGVIYIGQFGTEIRV